MCEPIKYIEQHQHVSQVETNIDGMMSASQTSAVPSPAMTCFLARRLKTDGVRASQAPLGLRRLEAALVAAGMAPEQIAVTPPERLKDAVGPSTRIIGLSSGDPLGIGMNSTTMAGIAGGEIYVGRWFRRLARRIARLRRRAPNAKVVMGGAGSWQLAQDGATREALGIDHVITGYCEGNVAELFDRIMADDATPPVLEEDVRHRVRHMHPAGRGVLPDRAAAGRVLLHVRPATGDRRHNGRDHRREAVQQAGELPHFQILGRGHPRGLAPVPGHAQGEDTRVHGKRDEGGDRFKNSEIFKRR